MIEQEQLSDVLLVDDQKRLYFAPIVKHHLVPI